MIIQVRGTSGAGKTHLVRMLMKQYSHVTPVRPDVIPTGKKRKHPIGYILSLPDSIAKDLFVPGHYETACGGADTINWAKTPANAPVPGISGWDWVNQLVESYANNGLHVLYEGLMVGYDKRHIRAFHKEFPCAIIGLNTSLRECIDNVKRRRAERGDTSRFISHNTRQRIPVFQRGMDVLSGEGIPVYQISVDEAFLKCLDWLELPYKPVNEAHQQVLGE